jgi:hypothetical protein
MVVFESAVCTALGFASSARTAEAMLTAPTAARPNVHLLNFICSSDVVWLFVYLLERDKNSLSLHLEGAFDFKIREKHGN